ELERQGVHILRATEVVETEPFGVTEQPRFLNQVLEAEWAGGARALLEACKEVERALGRTETYRWGPREIDVDILLHGEEAVDEPGLQIPHPGLRERDFVRRPLLQLRPDLGPLVGSPLLPTFHVAFDARLSVWGGLTNAAYRLYAPALAECDKVIVFGRNQRDLLAGLGVPERKLAVLPNGVDVDKYSPGAAAWKRKVDADRLFVHLGRLDAEKNVDELV